MKLFESKQRLKESKLSRIWQHIQGDNSFGIVSPFRAIQGDETITQEEKDKENEANYAELKKLVRAKGYGFIEMVGGFTEEGNKTVVEKSLFIPNVKKEDIINWGKKYNQYSIIYKDANGFQEIGTNPSAGIGQVKTDFIKKGWDKNMTFDKDLTKELFSTIAKGSHRGKKFLFNLKESFLKEQMPVTFNEMAYHKKRVGDESTMITLFESKQRLKEADDFSQFVGKTVTMNSASRANPKQKKYKVLGYADDKYKASKQFGIPFTNIGGYAIKKGTWFAVEVDGEKVLLDSSFGDRLLDTLK